VDSGTASKKQRLAAWLAVHQPASIGEAEWDSLLRELAPISESYLRELLRRTGLPFEQPWAGVRQKTFEELEASLEELRRVYAESLAAGLKDRARYCRRVVIAAKDHARFAARNPRTGPAVRARKEEMVEWMLVWLGDPDLFPEWVRARKRVMPLLQ
jgi:nucleotidyltransferase/DNA polymerase involved in DNA repair